MIKHLTRLILLVFCLHAFVGSSQVKTKTSTERLLKDSTIFFDELVFNTDSEKKHFKDIYLNKSEDYFSLIYMVKKGVDLDKLAQSRSKLYDKIDHFKAKNIKSKGEKKSIKYIYKEVHNTFFKKYERLNHFNDVFSLGYYNCLSASFLYSLVLEELDIPYQINILPDHVNLTVYPETHRILLETTDPVKGYFSFNKKFRENYVASLLAYKIIDESDIMRASLDELFYEHYSSKEVVNLKQLVGAQYYNDGLYLMDAEKNNEAIIQLEKSIALYPSTSAARVLISLYLMEITESNYSNQLDLDYLAKIMRYKELGIDEGSVIFEFNKLVEHHLNDKSDTNYLKKSHEFIQANLTIDSIKIDVKSFYHASLGDYYIKKLKYKEAAENYLQVIKLGDDSEGMKNLYVNAVVLHANGFVNKKKTLDYVNTAEQNCKSVSTDRLFLSFKAEVYCMLMIQCFDQSKQKEAEEYRGLMENVYDNFDVLISENNVGIAYAQAASYYFRKGNRSKAKTLLKKGLEYSPENYELESRLKMISY